MLKGATPGLQCDFYDWLELVLKLSFAVDPETCEESALSH